MKQGVRLAHLMPVNGKRRVSCKHHGRESNWCCRCKLFLCPPCTGWSLGYEDVTLDMKDSSQIRRLCRNCYRVWVRASKAFFAGKVLVLAKGTE